MGYIRKRGKRWAVEVERNGVRQHSTHATKASALQWMLSAERGDTLGIAKGRTVG